MKTIAQEGSYIPDLREELGKKIILQRARETKLKDDVTSAKKASKDKDVAEKEAAENHAGLVPSGSGRGVSAPSGVEMTNDVLEGLAGLGTHTSSHTGKCLCYSSRYIVSNDTLTISHPMPLILNQIYMARPY